MHKRNRKNMFMDVDDLYLIDLSSNQIESIDKNELKNLSTLYQLDLKSNKLTNLDYNFIQGCDNLRTFCLYGNSFPEKFTLNFTNLKNLD